MACYDRYEKLIYYEKLKGKYLDHLWIIMEEDSEKGLRTFLVNSKSRRITDKGEIKPIFLEKLKELYSKR